MVVSPDAGQPRLWALRVLVYSRMKGLENNTGIVEHLKRHRVVVKALDLRSVPRPCMLHIVYNDLFHVVSHLHALFLSQLF